MRMSVFTEQRVLSFGLQLKEVRREVELSRRRSIKLKAQVDKLQESREGQGWSQHRERVRRRDAAPDPAQQSCYILSLFPSVQVTDDILSILRLLSPLTEPESTLPQPPHHENQLDVALAQLQNVARKLAMSHSTQVCATHTHTRRSYHVTGISVRTYFSWHASWKNVCFAHSSRNEEKHHLMICSFLHLHFLKEGICAALRPLQARYAGPSEEQSFSLCPWQTTGC